MPVRDILSAALSGPAGRVVEGPVRDIVNEVLRDRGYASPAEVQALRDDLAAMQDAVASLTARVESLGEEAATLRTQADSLRQQAEDATARAAAAEAAAAEATAAEATAAEATAAEAAAAEAAPLAAEAERHGMSVEEYQQWLQGGLPGRVGPDGHVDVNGETYQIDAQYAGREYTLTRHKSPRVMVDGTMVSKTKVD